MFRPFYLKEGPGIPKDAQEKTGAAWAADTLVREFWQIVKLNALGLLCALPVVTFGASRAAMARCAVNMARDVPNDVWSDFRAALRENAPRNMLFGVLELALLAMGLALVTTAGFFPALLGMLLLCVTVAFFQNFWAIQAAIDIPTAAVAKNAWLLCLLRPGMTLLGLGLNLLLFVPAGLFFPLSLPYILLLPFGLSGFVSGMIGWSSCKRYLIR